MDKMEEYTNVNEEAKFNMALSTLKRLDIILQQIKQLNYSMAENSIFKQRAHLALVKELYIASYPLFPQVEEKEKLMNLQEEVLKLKMKKKSFSKNGNQKISEYFDEALEKKLFEITITIQMGLNKFFMPKGGDDDDDY